MPSADSATFCGAIPRSLLGPHATTTLKRTLSPSPDTKSRASKSRDSKRRSQNRSSSPSTATPCDTPRDSQCPDFLNSFADDPYLSWLNPCSDNGAQQAKPAPLRSTEPKRSSRAKATKSRSKSTRAGSKSSGNDSISNDSGLNWIQIQPTTFNTSTTNNNACSKDTTGMCDHAGPAPSVDAPLPTQKSGLLPGPSVNIGDSAISGDPSELMERRWDSFGAPPSWMSQPRASYDHAHRARQLMDDVEGVNGCLDKLRPASGPIPGMWGEEADVYDEFGRCDMGEMSMHEQRMQLMQLQAELEESEIVLQEARCANKILNSLVGQVASIVQGSTCKNLEQHQKLLSMSTSGRDADSNHVSYIMMLLIQHLFQDGDNRHQVLDMLG